MRRTVRLRAHAKVNLSLDVLSRRPDGYHNLASVMQTISLHDTLVVEPCVGDRVDLCCEGIELPGGSGNLAWRAADALLREWPGRGGVRLRLDKRIPLEAGLGGGSSDAAAALRGVAAALGLPCSPEQLGMIAARLGSDVPFFLTGGTAVVRESGGSVEPLADAPQLWFVVVKPGCGVSTARAYADLDAIPGRISARGTRRMLAVLAEGDAWQVAQAITNDFESVVPETYPMVMAAMDDLGMARGRSVHLCGSGAAVFATCADEAEAQAVAGLVRRGHPGAGVYRGIGGNESMALEEVAVG